MPYISSAAAPRHPTCAKTPVSARRGLLGHLYDAIMASHQRQAEREIARYFRDRGVKFTDETEREIQRRFLSTPSRW